MKKLMFAMVAALSFAVMAQDAAAPKGPKDGPRRDPRAMMMRGGMGGEMMGDPAVMAVMNPKIAEKIGLSEDIRNQIKKFETDNRAKVRDLQAKTRAAMEKQAKLMKEEKIDEAAVMAAIDELFDCRKEMAKAQTKRVITIKSLLTPEQLKQAAEEMKNLREARRGKRGSKPESKEGDKPVPPPPQAE